MEDDRLADLLEELPEDEQIRLLQGLDLERAAHVLEEMEPDDAADLLGELPEPERQRLLEAMEPEESTPIRRLLAYDEDTAGGLMTPEPIVLNAATTVAEALATVREPDLPMELAAQVFVVRPPTSTPTGRFLGTVPFQRLLREAPGTRLEDCAHADPEPVDLLDAEAHPVGVDGRGVISAAPARLGRHPVVGWAGPWPLGEQWWGPDRSPRRARDQVGLGDQARKNIPTDVGQIEIVDSQELSTVQTVASLIHGTALIAALLLLALICLIVYLSPGYRWLSVLWLAITLIISSILMVA